VEEKKQKKVLGPLEIITFLAGIGLLLFITIRNGGCQIMQHTESTEIINNPGSNDWQETRRPYKSQRKESVDEVLSQIAEQFSDNQPAYNRDLQKKGMSEEEISFYDQLKDTYGNKISNAKSWYQILKAAQSTYQQMDRIFSDASGQPAETLRPDDLSHLFDDPRQSTTLLRQLQQEFDIPAATIEGFVQQGSHRLSEWAAFIEKESNGDGQ